MKEKRKFVLRVREIVRDSSGVVCGFKNERRIEFEVEDYPDFIQLEAFSTAGSLLGVDVVAGVANRFLDVCMLEFGASPFHVFSLCVSVSGDVRWVYDVPGCFVKLDGSVYVSEQADSNCDIAEEIVDKCEDASELNTDVSKAEECEYASEADLAHLFGYDLDLPSTDFCDYGDNGFYIV